MRPLRQVLLLLAGMTVVAGRIEGAAVVTLCVAALGAAAAVDTALWAWRRRPRQLPESAAVTALLVAGVFGASAPWTMVVTATAVGLATKHALRVGRVHIFNPAAAGLVGAALLSDAPQNWWIALPRLVPAASWPLLIGAGAYVAWRVRRLPIALSFLAVYLAALAAATFVIDAVDVADVFQPPDLNAAVFTAGFMLTDPPTSPSRFTVQVIVGAAAALAAAAVCLLTNLAWFLLAGVLTANVVGAFLRRRPGPYATAATARARVEPANLRR